MKRLLPILSSLAISSLPAQAAPDRVMTVTATVDGMVCSFCAQGLLAHFRKHAAVSDIHVDLARKLVILEERKGAAISDEEIRAAVKRAGFDPPAAIRRVTTSFDEVKKGK